MQVFYSNKISDNTILIDEQEHIHLTKVLRKAPGDEVFVCNGEGLMVLAKIVTSNKKQTVLETIEIIANKTENSNQLILAVAPTKNIDRYQWMIEKCTEIGVKKIVPFYSKHSERRRLKVSRLHLIAVSAMKQSKSLFLPEITEPIRFKDVLKLDAISQKYIAYMEEKTQSINSTLSEIYKEKEMLITIGPEGGFSSDEITEARKHGFDPITLGAKRLRTETAAVYSAVAYQLI